MSKVRCPPSGFCVLLTSRELLDASCCALQSSSTRWLQTAEFVLASFEALVSVLGKNTMTCLEPPLLNSAKKLLSCWVKGSRLLCQAFALYGALAARWSVLPLETATP